MICLSTAAMNSDCNGMSMTKLHSQGGFYKLLESYWD